MVPDRLTQSLSKWLNSSMFFTNDSSDQRLARCPFCLIILMSFVRPTTSAEAAVLQRIHSLTFLAFPALSSCSANLLPLVTTTLELHRASYLIAVECDVSL